MALSKRKSKSKKAAPRSSPIDLTAIKPPRKRPAAFATDSFHDTGRRPASESWPGYNAQSYFRGRFNSTASGLHEILAKNDQESLKMTASEAMAAENEALSDLVPQETAAAFIGYTPAEIEVTVGQLRVLRETMTPDEAYSRGALYAAAAMLACYRDDQARKYDEAERAQVAQQLDAAVAAAFANGGVEAEKNRAKEARRGNR